MGTLTYVKLCLICSIWRNTSYFPELFLSLPRIVKNLPSFPGFPWFSFNVKHLPGFLGFPWITETWKTILQWIFVEHLEKAEHKIRPFFRTAHAASQEKRKDTKVQLTIFHRAAHKNILADLRLQITILQW